MNESETSPARTGSRLQGALRSLLESVGLAFCFYLIIANYAVAAYEIPSGSMIPTLEVGDRLLVCPSTYDLNLVPPRLRLGPFDLSSPLGAVRLAHLSQPARGDIIVFHLGGVNRDSLIKRVIGLPGETVEVRGDQVLINGRALDDPWGRHQGGGSWGHNFGPVTVPPEHYFVMGDNRDNSFDSRFWNQGLGGFVPRDRIQGQALVLYWPGVSQTTGRQWSRLGRLDH